ncbi:MAG: hypothetical protein AB7D51_04820, partial [Desulfovibrionaceae bacterium]
MGIIEQFRKGKISSGELRELAKNDPALRAEVEALLGRELDADELEGIAAAGNINGSQDDDTLIGGTGDDFIYGGSGADEMDGGEGDDTLDGGYGDGADDTAFGGEGDDSFIWG